MTRTHFNPVEVLTHGAKSRAQKRRPPTWIAPMLATLTDERFSRQGWLFEPKLDGERCLVFGRRGTLRLLSRNRQLEHWLFRNQGRRNLLDLAARTDRLLGKNVLARR